MKRNVIDNKIVASLIVFSFSTFLCFFEAHSAKRNNIMRELEMSVAEINGDMPDMSNDGRLVYFKANSTLYDLVKDHEFGIAEYCGRMVRNVQYCQWHQRTVTHTRKVNNKEQKTYSYQYYKGWSGHQINSLFFHNLLYSNPRVSEVPQTVKRGRVKAGSYMLDDNMELNGKTITLEPHIQQIDNFMASSYSDTFKYAGRGIFYREYERGFLEKVVHIATFFNTDNADAFDWCTPGDTRVWYTIWAPPSISVIGEKNGDIIKKKEYKEIMVGAAYSGHVSLRKVLESNVSLFPTVMKWILRVVLIAICVASFFNDIGINFVSIGAIISAITICHNQKFINTVSFGWHNFLVSAVLGAVISLVYGITI